MASGSVSRVDDLPPALPLKQHSRSSVEAECDALSPVGLRAQNDAFNDVFVEPTDCHAAQCPIHQRYDPSRHQERFFSDGTPPPVPKKRFARTLSFPATSASPQCPWSPLSLLPKRPQNYDNPLYMLAPVPGSYFHQRGKEVKTERRSPVPSLSLSQLSFDTSDEHLPQLFDGFDDQRVVSQGIQHCHLLFLRSVVQNMEAGILLQDAATDNHARSYQPQDFLLNEGSQPKQIGNSFYYSLHSPEFPGRVLGLKVHKQTNENPTPHQLSHVNVQNVVAVFTPSVKLKRSDPATPIKTGCTAANPPDGGSTEYSPAMSNVTTVESLLEDGMTVSVERDLPQATLEDFVQDSSSLQSADCLVWERQVSVLLLQILMASQHLYNTSATASELRPWEIFLVWSCRERREGKGFKIGRLKEDLEWEETASKGRTQMLWRTRGSPRVVLNPQSLSLSASHPLPSIKSQIGALLQYCLAPQERSISSLDSDPSPSKSFYQRGLLHLSSLLQNESSSLQIVDMVAMLQVLLWGPSVTLFNHFNDRSVTAAVNSWLTVKRALLVMKLAERGLMGDQAALDWDDYMCLQYLSSTDPETVGSVTRQLFEDGPTSTGRPS